MNTYTKIGEGVATRAPQEHVTGAFSGCRTLRFQGCGFFMTWPRRRNGARAKGVHGPTLRYEGWGTRKTTADPSSLGSS